MSGGRKHLPKMTKGRAVDSNGDILDILVQSPRDTQAANRFFRKFYKRFGEPRLIVTDKLGSYGAALKVLGLTLMQ